LKKKKQKKTMTLLLTTALVALWFQFPTSVYSTIELSSLISMQTTSATLEPNQIYTISRPFTLTTTLVLNGGFVTSTLPNKAKILCASTCFEIGQSVLSLTNLAVEFGTANNSSASFINVPAFNSSVSAYGGTLVLIDTNVTSSPANPQVQVLVSHERVASLYSFILSTSNVTVSSVFQIVGNTGSLAVGAALSATTIQITNSSISCRSAVVDCVGLGDFHGSTISIQSSKFGFINSVVPGPRSVPLIRVNGSTTTDQGRPTVTVEHTDVPTKEIFSFENVKETELRSVKLGAHALFRVSRAPSVHASNLEQGESTVTPAWRFTDVGNVTIVGITLTGGTADFGTYCTAVPAVGIGSTSNLTFMQVAHVTRLKVSGYFCPPSMEAGIVTIQGVDAVSLIDSEFGNCSSARAIEVREAKSVNVISVMFQNVSTSHSGTLRVRGRADFGTVVTVEQSTFRHIRNSYGSAVDVNHASLTLRSVSFVNNTHSSTTSGIPSCVWVDNVFPSPWSKDSEVVFNNVSFVANSGNQIVVINVNVAGANGPMRKIWLEDVSFVNNSPSKILCELNGATYHVIKGLNITKNSGTIGLAFTQAAFTTMGQMERVCICENDASISSSPISCNGGSMLSGNSIVTPGAAGRCLPQNSVRACAPGACQFVTSGTGMSVTTGPTTQQTTTTTTATTTTTTPAITQGGTTFIGTSRSRTFVASDGVPIGTIPEQISDATSSTTVEIATVGSSAGAMDGSTTTTTTTSSISAVSMPTSPDSNTSATSDIILMSRGVDASESAPAMSLLDDTAVLGGIIGGIVAFVVLVILGILLAMMLTKRRRRGQSDSPGETPLQDQATTRMGTETTSASMTGNYGSVQSALPAHYGKSKFSSLN
jgi:hypothetical protein